ncbi:MAG: phosphate signaling complex protein PhoU [Candidatus Bipolaricaulota bacterium]|nr:phosphate signaling complex protein PhoU [Candidatus Bipolaricaulota bacterium]MCX7843789.1 phosphate signaling complex protein PhoU [Candidatus Bipolaricaulota bacterium]MDW8151371.1 phosphate signaling complex protein PhoU [Candidatus Bipolaricaulota bacterium]
MVREGLVRSLQALEAEVEGLGRAVAQALRHALHSLKAQDLELAQAVVSGDLEINRQRFAIEEKCLELLATQQPMASDLRLITALMHIVTDLERMGDHAAGLARITLLIGKTPLIKPLVDIPRMTELALGMLEGALDALRRRDAEAARRIALRDDEVDALHDQVHRELFLLMIQEPRNITQATYLMWASHNLERFADLVTNICERVIFVVTGRMEELNVSG